MIVPATGIAVVSERTGLRDSDEAGTGWSRSVTGDGTSGTISGTLEFGASVRPSTGGVSSTALPRFSRYRSRRNWTRLGVFHGVSTQYTPCSPVRATDLSDEGNFPAAIRSGPEARQI